MATPKEAPKSTPTAAVKVVNFDISHGGDALALAPDLAKFIKENGLTHNVQGKEYVNVEGWQYAGTRLGIVPVVDQLLNLSADGEMKYQAKVYLFDLRSQQTVGGGFAVCSNKENGKKFYAEYAIASMAQTRAIGKAYRNLLAWIIRAAGYEPTPAEEMDYQTMPTAATPTPATANPTPAGNAPGAQGSTNRGVSAGAAPSADARRVEYEPGEGPAPEAPEVRYATAKQKEEIIRLLNNATVTNPEKTKMLLNINKLDTERADMAINKLVATIAEREADRATQPAA